ncbi:hypothetical protein DM01DRAFT_1383297 [Hesseltinella vesiculosa]|uniref:SPIN90/Ldb17 leucine-rich domain-containing protein n=1 Tax=Hesseltinella vesiculosa TaxID=101127 RepID=A0A1X2GIN5_9FUNG|nr:hypothetical protein DM01DRAFT_1383297 [Hesseltinella vesiculosa]
MDFVDYYFDDIESFHAELGDLLEQPCESDELARQRTNQYVQFLVRFQKEFITTAEQMAQVAYKLIDSTFYLEHSTTILSHVLQGHALLCKFDQSHLLVSYGLLFYAGKEDPRWMQYVVSEAILRKQNRLFVKIINELSTLYPNRLVMSMALSLAFEMGKVATLKRLDLETITLERVTYLLDLVESSRTDADEQFHNDIIFLLLVFNEQFLMAEKRSNLVIKALTNRLHVSTTFGENLIFMLNRSDDPCVQLLLLKLLYTILNEPKLYEYFYTNDLYVLVDIILREVCDLGDDSDMLRDAYLRILKPLLLNTQLHDRPYKKNEIYQVLCSLITPHMDRKVDPNIKGLAVRILDEWWDKTCAQHVAPLLGVHVQNAVIHSGTGREHAAVAVASSSPTTSSNSSSLSTSPPLASSSSSSTTTANKNMTWAACS